MDEMTLGGSRVALLLCGSFNPPTFLHLRMFERARDFLQQECKCQVLEGLISPVSDHFKKPSLISARHRFRMAQLAAETSDWIVADNWECSRDCWSRTLEVLRHHRKRLRQKYSDDNLRVVMLCGGDTLASFTRQEPTATDGRLWNMDHLKEMFADYGLVVIERVGSHEHTILKSPELDFLQELLHNVAIVQEDVFPNEMSSTRLRDAVQQGRSIRYCTPDSVVDYIREHRLYI